METLFLVNLHIHSEQKNNTSLESALNGSEQATVRVGFQFTSNSIPSAAITGGLTLDSQTVDELPDVVVWIAVVHGH